jgi:tetratricopeptide (TPR) repeat protein
MLAQHRPAGLPDGLAPDELERWSNELVAYLTSDGVPSNLRGWARKQADMVDAYMASAEDFGADADDKEDKPARAPATAASSKPKTLRPAVTSSRADVDPNAGMFVVRLPQQTARLGMGIAIGALAVAAIFVVHSITGGSGSSLPAVANATAAPFNQARVDQLQAKLAQDPSDKDALYELGEIYFEATRFEDAISTLTKLVDLDPQNKNALTDIGTANFNLGNPDLAKEWWQKVLAIDPNDVQAHYNMGFVYANAEPRDLPGAVKEWETVVQLDPTSQLGQTAKVHVEGLKAQLTVTPAAGLAATTPAP